MRIHCSFLCFCTLKHHLKYFEHCTQYLVELPRPIQFFLKYCNINNKQCREGKINSCSKIERVFVRVLNCCHVSGCLTTSGRLFHNWTAWDTLKYSTAIDLQIMYLFCLEITAARTYKLYQRTEYSELTNTGSNTHFRKYNYHRLELGVSVHFGTHSFKTVSQIHAIPH